MRYFVVLSKSREHIKILPHLTNLCPLVGMPSEFILRDMTRRLYNWTYRDVTSFLKESGFSFLKPLKGSHEAWIKRGSNDTEPDRRVEVNLTHGSYPAVTLKLMIRQSGIPQNEWIKWGSS